MHLNTRYRPFVLTFVAIILVLLTPLLVFNFIVLNILRAIILLCALLFRPDLTKPLQPTQGAMALERIHQKPKMNIVVHNMIQGELLTEKFRARFAERVLNLKNEKGRHVYPELRQFKATFCDKYFWKMDENFDLKNHIRDYDYTTEGDLQLPEICTRADLERITGELLAQPWTKGRSPWEILLIHDYRENGPKDVKQSVFVLRIHHLMADGYSILRIIWRCLDNHETVEFPEPSFPKLSFWQKCVVAARLPFYFYYHLAVAAVDGSDGKNSWHLIDQKLSRKFNTCIVDKIPISLIKQVRRRYGVAYNAVLAAIVAGGIRRLMMDLGQKVPKSIAAFLPLPIPDHPDGLSVDAVGLLFRMPMRDVPTERRLEMINDSFSEIKRVEFLWGSKILLALVSPYPAFVAKAVQGSAVKCTALFSSFPSFERRPMVLGGRHTDSMFAFGLPPGKPAVSITMLSGGEDQRILVTVDKTVLESREKLRKISDYIHDELRELLRKDGEIV